jgi:glycerate 2-kinase
MKVCCAVSGFKESLDPVEAANCIEKGILRALPNAIVQKVPLVDGGEGTVQAIVTATNGRVIPILVRGPIGELVESHFGLLGDRPDTVVIEMAAAAGLRLVPRTHRDPTKTTSYGVGETILAALDHGAKHILLGCGDSGICDAGMGMLQAVGARLIDMDGNEIPVAAGIQGLSRLSRIDLEGVDKRLKEVKIDVACNWHNVLCGPHGVARVFGPQKGATESQVEEMSQAMERCATIIGDFLDKDVSNAPGSGASGGLGVSLMLLGAELHPRYDIMSSFFDLNKVLDNSELCFTSEGAIDFQTPKGKIPAMVAQRAKKRGIPCIAIAGTVGKDAHMNYDIGIDAYASILQGPCTLEKAIEDANRLLTESAEAMMRVVLIGKTLRELASTPQVAMQSKAPVPGLVRRAKTCSSIFL